MVSDVQAVLFDRDKWIGIKAHQWLMKHGLYPTKSPHYTKNKIRFRLENPKNFSRLRNKKIGKDIELIIGFY